jgi:hypothetical protein
VHSVYGINQRIAVVPLFSLLYFLNFNLINSIIWAVDHVERVNPMDVKAMEVAAVVAVIV